MRVDPAQAGAALIDLLTRRFTYHDRDGWLRHIAAGRLRINGTVASATQRLSAGDTVEFLVPPLAEPPVCTAVTVLHEDAHLLVLDKPGNLPCHPGGRFFANTLWALLRARPGLAHFDFVNRIDRETSGIVLLGKTPQATQHCRRQFANGTVRKRYLVVVEGEFPDALDADGVLVPDSAGPVRQRRIFIAATALTPTPTTAMAEGAESAQTRFRRLSRHGSLSLVEALPRTGRRHQIRATLSSLGWPVVGDKLYGVDPTLFLRFRDGTLSAADLARLRLERQALHAESLELRHPDGGRTVRFTAPMPADMAALL